VKGKNSEIYWWAIRKFWDLHGQSLRKGGGYTVHPVPAPLSTAPLLIIFVRFNLETWVSKRNAFCTLSNDSKNLSWLNLFYSGDLGPVTIFLVLYLFLMLALFRIRNWLSYILILILLGGLLVIFIYISLLAPNENQFSFGFLGLRVGILFFLLVSFGTSDLIIFYISFDATLIHKK
jgi:hypothetical protein